MFDSSHEPTTNDNEGVNDDELTGDFDNENGTTIDQAKNRFAECDQAFTELYNSLADKVWQSKQNDSVERVIQDLSNVTLDVADHLGRSLLHVAVELGNYDFVSCLLKAATQMQRKCVVQHLLS